MHIVIHKSIGDTTIVEHTYIGATVQRTTYRCTQQKNRWHNMHVVARTFIIGFGETHRCIQIKRCNYCCTQIDKCNISLHANTNTLVKHNHIDAHKSSHATIAACKEINCCNDCCTQINRCSLEEWWELQLALLFSLMAELLLAVLKSDAFIREFIFKSFMWLLAQKPGSQLIHRSRDQRK
jgi:hypothetical protein